MRRFLFLFITAWLLFFQGFSYGQTDHYWAQQFGAQSSLMGGAMIGGVRDNSAIFYNPGAFSFIEFPSLSVNANLYKIDKIFIDDGAGDGINLNSAQISIFPQIISGMMKMKSMPRFQFAYGLMTREYDNILMNTRYTNMDFPEIIDSVDGYIGVFDLASQLNEQWFGLGIGYRISDHFGIGITFFGSYRTQTTKMSHVIREIIHEDDDFGIGSMVYQEMVKAKSAGGLAKIGLSYEQGRWRAGLTFTTPSFQVYGRGNIEREISIYYISGSAHDTSQSFILSDRVNDIHARYRHPFTIGAGVEYNNGKTRIAFSCEYYFRVKAYQLMNPSSNPFVYPPVLKDSTFFREIIQDFLKIDNGAKPVFNFGIGLDQRLSTSFSLLAGFHTDFSNYTDLHYGDNMIHSSGGWDLYHFSLGLSYHLKKQIITAGVNYAFSPAVSIDPFAKLSPFTEEEETARVFPQTFAFILGYTYLFPRE